MTLSDQLTQRVAKLVTDLAFGEGLDLDEVVASVWADRLVSVITTSAVADGVLIDPSTLEQVGFTGDDEGVAAEFTEYGAASLTLDADDDHTEPVFRLLTGGEET